MRLKSTLKQAQCPLEKWWIKMDKQTAVGIITTYMINANIDLARQNGISDDKIEDMVSKSIDGITKSVDALYDFMKSKDIL